VSKGNGRKFKEVWGGTVQVWGMGVENTTQRKKDKAGIPENMKVVPEGVDPCPEKKKLRALENKKEEKGEEKDITSKVEGEGGTKTGGQKLEGSVNTEREKPKFSKKTQGKTGQGGGVRNTKKIEESTTSVLQPRGTGGTKWCRSDTQCGRRGREVVGKELLSETPRDRA